MREGRAMQFPFRARAKKFLIPRSSLYSLTSFARTLRKKFSKFWLVKFLSVYALNVDAPTGIFLRMPFAKLFPSAQEFSLKFSLRKIRGAWTPRLKRVAHSVCPSR
jgi:hypothetical protein